MRDVIDGKLYNTETATLLASDRYWDGHNWDRHGRNQYLYRTKKGNYFLHTTSMWEGSFDNILPLNKEEAKAAFERLPEQEMTWEDAFGEIPEEA